MSEMLWGAVGLAVLILVVILAIRFAQWQLLYGGKPANSVDRKQDSPPAGSSGYRPGGVSWEVRGSEPIPVRHKRFWRRK